MLFFNSSSVVSPPLDIKTVRLKCPMEVFVSIVLDSNDFYQKFLSEQILEREISISQWVRQDNMFKRTVESIHPLPPVLSWLPVEVVNASMQSLAFDSTALRFQEKCKITGLQVIEPTVVNDWTLVELSADECELSFSLSFEYESFNILQSVLEFQTTIQMQNFYDLFEAAVKEGVNRYRDNETILPTKPTLVHLKDLLNS